MQQLCKAYTPIRRLLSDFLELHSLGFQFNLNNHPSYIISQDLDEL
jgi:hypothetical protein